MNKIRIVETCLERDVIQIGGSWTFKSGRVSPVYCDFRKVLGYLPLRSWITNRMCDLCDEIFDGAFKMPLVGGETAGIAFAALVASELACPMGYVRKTAKDHGTKRLVDGLEPCSVILIEDLMSDGASKADFVQTLRAEGFTVKNAVVAFSYGIFPEAKTLMDSIGLQVHSVLTFSDVIDAARTMQHPKLAQLERVANNPDNWSNENA